jgi:RNA polymerase sigma factor (sigma-70 family)
MNEPGTVFIVDDDESIIKPIVKMAEALGLKTLTYHSAIDFLDQCRPSGPACLVLDIWMPEMSGVALLTRMTEAQLTLPVIVISAHADVRLAVEIMRKGALNFLEKPFRMHELAESIQEAIRLDREAWCRHEVQESARNRFSQLSLTERQVLELLLANKTNKMIADQLGISVRTVENRRARIMRKLDVESRAQLLEMGQAGHVPAVF